MMTPAQTSRDYIPADGPSAADLAMAEVRGSRRLDRADYGDAAESPLGMAFAVAHAGAVMPAPAPRLPKAKKGLSASIFPAHADPGGLERPGKTQAAPRSSGKAKGLNPLGS